MEHAQQKSTASTQTLAKPKSDLGVVQRKALEGATARHGQAADVRSSLQSGGGGQPLPPQIQEQLSNELGIDLSSVRVIESDLPQRLGATAFATGNRIYFTPGTYDPNSSAGLELLRHELAHLRQQLEGRVKPGEDGLVNDDPALEREADAAASGTPQNQPAKEEPPQGPQTAVGDVVQCSDEDEEEPEPAEVITANMFSCDVTGQEATGNVTAQEAPSDNTKVSVNAPEYRPQATITLQEGHAVGDPVTVGATQTKVAGERRGIYRWGGNPDGRIIATRVFATDTTRDAMWTERDGNVEASYPEPWYGPQQRISDSSRTANVELYDQPGFELERELGQGRLTHIEGSDSFNSSFAARRGEEGIVHLHNWDWSVPWTLQLNADVPVSMGGTILSADSDTPPPVLTGEITVANARDWVRFASPEAAAAALSSAEIIRMLTVAQAEDQEAYNNLLAALRDKNPTFTIELIVRDTSEWFGADEIELTMQGHNQLVRGPFTLNDGEQRSIDVHMLRLFQASRLRDAAQPLSFTARDVGTLTGNPATLEWSWWHHQTDAEAKMSGPDDLHYRIHGNFHD